MSLPNQTHEIYTMDEPHASVFKKVSNNDVKYNPFFAYKQWTVYSGSATSSALPLTAIYSDANLLPALGTELTYNDSKNIDGRLQTLAYHSINNLIYKRKSEPYNTIGGSDLNYTKKFLYQSASILSFPAVKVGEGIKPQSFTFNIPSTASLKSDIYGNIYDTMIDTGSFVSDVMFYEGFNEYFDTTRNKYTTQQNVTFIPGVPTTSGTTQSVGYAAKFNGDGFISTDTQINGLYDRQHDYAVSFWISASNTAADNKTILGFGNIYTTQYPFKIQLNSSSKIIFSAASNDLLKTSISSSTAVTAWTHVLCQKSGSMMQLYINGVINSSASCAAFIIPNSALSQSGQINTSSPLYIGATLNVSGTNTSYLTGSIDEIRIFNKTISSASISSLNNRNEDTATFLQTANVGTLFHKQGLAIISSPHYKYNNILNSAYTSSYKSTKRLYELNVLTRISKGDFNMSTNPSLLADNNETYQTFVTSSGFAPYITTIGLYDNSGQLLAIGKLGQAIKKRDDVDMNFVIRIDLDAPISWKS